MDNLSITVENLKKRLGNQVILQDISFTHNNGVLGLSGSNGSGKSTLLKCMAALWKPSSGKISWRVNGETVGGKQFKQRLGYAAPYINLYHELTCFENLQFLLDLRNKGKQPSHIEQILQQVEMQAFHDQLYQSLSTGQKQRMKLGAALVHQPDVLFLDEPGSNLDRAGHALVKRVVEESRNEEKLTVVASNNRKELALCDHIFLIEEEAFDGE